MSKFGIILLCVILFPNLIWARQLRVELVGERKDLEPGTIHTLVFKIHNDSEDSTTIHPETVLPEQWRLTSALTAISLGAHEQRIYLVQVQIPSNAQWGRHELELILKPENVPAVSTVFELSVKSVQKLTVQSISTTPYVKAGDTIRQVFVLKNEGNYPEKIRLELTPEEAYIQGESWRTLKASELTEVQVTLPTDLRTPRPDQKSIRLTAFSMRDDPTSEDPTSEDPTSEDPTGVFAYSRTEVIPTFPVDEDIYHRFPIQVSTMYIARERDGDFRQAWQGEIYGKGSLDEKHRHQLEFRAIGPDRFELTTFTPYEEYFIQYHNKDFMVHLGDQVYSSSLLTEYARYGRGLELRKRLGAWEVAGFYNRPRFYKGIRDEFSLSTRYRSHPSSYLRSGYLMKRMETDAFTHHLQFLEGETTLWEHIQLKGEYAISQSLSSKGLPSKDLSSKGHGWHLQAIAHFQKVHASASYLNASPDFAGYYSNTHFFTSHINYRITPRLTIHGNFQQDARNFRRDTLYGTAPYRERMQAGLRFQYLREGTLGAYAGWHAYEDRHAVKQFHYEEQFVRLDLHQKIQNWGVNLQTHFGQTHNFLTQSKGNSSIYSAHLNYQIRQSFFSLYGSYSKLSRYQQAGQNQFLYGGRIQSSLSDQWTISAFYQNSYYLEDYYADRNLFELSTNYRVTPRHSFNLVSRYALARQQLDRKDFSMQIRYTFHFGMPVRKVKRYGSLSGRLTHWGAAPAAPEVALGAGTGSAAAAVPAPALGAVPGSSAGAADLLSGIQLHLGAQTTLVESDGTFNFRNVPPGLHFLEITPGSLGLRAITDVQLPARIQIEEGENFFDFGITQAARIHGEIHLTGDGSSSNHEVLAIMGTSSSSRDERVIVEISSDDEVFRKIVDIREGFDFTYLRPGDWRLKVYRNGLSTPYKILQDTFHLTLEPGAQQKVIVQIEKTQRSIQFLQPPMRVSPVESNR